MADQPLSADLIIEVLIRLPVKSILKFRCVSKTWRDMTRSPVFINAHQKRKGKQRLMLVKRYSSSQDGDREVLSFSDHSIPIMDDLRGHLHMICQSLPTPPSEKSGETFSPHDEDFLDELVSSHISIPIRGSLNLTWQRHSNITIHGPCNGLVCIAFEKTVFLCNPALREFKRLPPPAGCIALPFQHGLGFDPITGAYKIIQISDMRHEVPNDARFWYGPNTNSLRIDLYNSASDSWKQIQGEKLPDLSYLPGYELLYNGAIHWAIISPGSSPCVLCFDVSTETFRCLEFPDRFCPFERDLRLMEFDENLAVVRYQYQMIELERRKTEIWVMKQYGVKESWTKQFAIAPHRDICPLLFLRNELLSVESADGQPSALHENHFKGFQFYGAHLSMSSVFYEESLIRLNEITCK